MASFDFVEAASKGYRFIWENRAVVARIMLVPLVIKVFCSFAVVAYIDDQNFLRQGLFLIPSYFVEGWLIAQLIRMAVCGETWPSTFTGNQAQDVAYHMQRKRVILSGMIIYVLTKLMLAFISGYVMMEQIALRGDGEEVPVSPEPSLATFALGLGALLFIIWAFRLIWLYVPAVLDYSITGFLRRIKPYNTSFSLLGAWVLCFVPVVLALILLLKILMILMPGADESVSGMFKYVVVAFQAFFEMLSAALASVAIAFGVQSIYDGTNKSTPIL